MSETRKIPAEGHHSTQKRWLRPPILRLVDREERSATWLELFFDLCFVAAIAALGVDLHSDQTWEGYLRFAGLFVPIWWGWMGITWYATAFDTDDVIYRISLLVSMLAIVAIAVNVGRVKEGDTTGFVIAYLVMQVVVVGLFLRARQHAHETQSMTMRYAAGDALGAAIWLASLAFSTPAQYWIWGAAMAVLMFTPMYAVRAYHGQPFDSSHIPERYGLFTIIVLGESIVAVAAGISNTGWEFGTALTAATGFGIAACVWWVYFEFVESTVVRRDAIVRTFVWGYVHFGVYVGIAAAAIGIEIAIDGVAHDQALDMVERSIFLASLATYFFSIAVIHYNERLTFDATVIVRLASAAAMVALIYIGGEIHQAALVPAAFSVVLAQTLFEVLRAGPQASSPEASEHH